MKRSCTLLIMLLMAVMHVTAQQFQLAPPMVKYSSVFFVDTVSVTMGFAQQGTTIRYTIDGSEPSIKSKRYTGPVVINKHLTTLKAKVFAKEYLPSDAITITFILQGLPVKAVGYTTPHPQYSGNGNSDILFDNKGGIPDFTNRNWLGFQQDTVEINITLKQKTAIRSVLFNVLQDYGAWIFFPSKAELLINNSNGQLTTIRELNMVPKQHEMSKAVYPFIFHLSKKITAEKMVLRLHLLKNIPAWHPGNGQPAWIFIDEIKLF